MLNDIKEVLFSEEYLANIVQRMGKQISEDYKDKNLLMVSVLKGSVVFMADLMRAISVPCRVDFMSVSSYGSGVKTSGVVKDRQRSGHSAGWLRPVGGGRHPGQRHDAELHTGAPAIPWSPEHPAVHAVR